MLNRSVYLALGVLLLTAGLDARKTSSGRSRGSSGRGTSRRTNYSQAAPTSFSNPAPKQESSLFGWQTKAKEAPARSSQTAVSHQSRASQQSHSYPSSQTGMSGHQQPPAYEQAVKQSPTYSQNSKPQQTHTYPQSNPQSGSPQNHGYPASGGLSGQSGVGGGYPSQSGTGLSGASAPAYSSGQGSRPGNTQSHSYPASGSSSGYSGAGGSYPAQPGGGLSGTGYSSGQAARPGYSAPGSYPAGAPGSAYPASNYGSNNYHPPAHGPPPSYPVNHGPGYGSPGYNHPGGYGQAGYGGGGYGPGGFGGPGGYGGYNYGKYGGMNRGTSTLSKVGIAGAGVGTLLTGLALWNLARSGSNRNTHIYQDHRGNPIPVPINDTTPAKDPILGELVNCTLTVSGANATEVFGIPCVIASSFSPNSDLHKGVDTSGSAEEAKCIITVVTINGTELSTTIPCSILLNTAKEANVTEPPPLAINGTDLAPGDGVNGSNPALPITPVGNFGSPVGVPLAPFPGGDPSQQTSGINSSFGNGAFPVGVGEPVPLAPFPGGDLAQQAAAFNASPLTLSPGVSPPPCKLNQGVTPDPINPCVPMIGDVSVIPLLPANSTAQAAAAA